MLPSEFNYGWWKGCIPSITIHISGGGRQSGQCRCFEAWLKNQRILARADSDRNGFCIQLNLINIFELKNWTTKPSMVAQKPKSVFPIIALVICVGVYLPFCNKYKMVRVHCDLPAQLCISDFLFLLFAPSLWLLDGKSIRIN